MVRRRDMSTNRCTCQIANEIWILPSMSLAEIHEPGHHGLGSEVSGMEHGIVKPCFSIR